MATCVNCGADLAKNARYCSDCGAPRRGAGGAYAAAFAALVDNAEICAIDWSHGYVRSDFFAVVVDSAGTSTEIARSPRFAWRKKNPPPSGHERARAAHDALVAELVERGWTSIGSDWDPWYAVCFRQDAARLRAPVGTTE